MLRASAQATAVVSGVVQTHDAQVIPGATVTVMTFANGTMDSVATRTNARGEFSLGAAC